MSGLKFRGRPPIRLAESVKDVVYLRDPYAQAIMDRSVSLSDEVIEAILGQSLFSWEGRNPSPALDMDGNFQGTDLDLLSFLVPLAERGAVIEIPHYRNMRKVVKRENERRVSERRFGPIRRMISSSKALSFSCLIHDKGVAVTDPRTGVERLGAWRNYAIVGCDGHWYNGWDSIEWDPSKGENAFLTEKDLWSGNSVVFTHYVHPNRWQSVFGAPHLLLKMLLIRLDDEAQHYRKEVERIKSCGLTFSDEMRKDQYARPPDDEECPTEKIQVQTIEMPLVIDSFTGKYPMEVTSRQGLTHAYLLQKHLTYSVKPKVQFITRANEAAYFKHGLGDVAHWMEGRLWVSRKEKKTMWNQMILSNDCVLRYRVKTVTEEISAL